MSESEEPRPRSIGFVYQPPHLEARLADRLAREFDDPRGAARFRWLVLAAVALAALSRTQLSTHFHVIREHPIMAAVIAVLGLFFLPLLIILPANIISVEMRLFEMIRPTARVIVGRNAFVVFSLTLAIELLAAGGLFLALRPPIVEPPVAVSPSTTLEINQQKHTLNTGNRVIHSKRGLPNARTDNRR